MTAVTDSKPRANRKGTPCPPWCATDHDEVLVPEKDGRAAIYFDVHTAKIGDMMRGGPWADVLQGESDDHPHVYIGTCDMPAMDPKMARAIAGLLESVSWLGKEGITVLAAEVRRAASVIDGAGAGQ